MQTKLIINASNVRSHGGLVLLRKIIKSLPKNLNVIFLLNKCLKEEFIALDSAYFFGSNLLERLKAELFIKKIAEKKDKLLCFGNLPPLFRSKARVFVFFHNVTMIRKFSAFNLYFIFATKDFNFIVQSNTVKIKLTSSQLFNNRTVHILPFFERINKKLAPNNIKRPNKETFIYPANGEPHKNHINLINAWTALANDNIYPKLIITISSEAYPKLFRFIENNINKYNLDIDNLEEVSHSLILSYLNNSNALIYPSLTESLGIPLLEAKSLDIPIVASELDYVRDISSPIQTFDPKSSISISRAVKRFLGKEGCSIKVEDPNSFIEFILNT
jgi:glycosyltransferase involved in cell wall biosynthesis